MSRIRYLGYLRIFDRTAPMGYYRVYSRKDKHGQRVQRRMALCGTAKDVGQSTSLDRCATAKK